MTVYGIDSISQIVLADGYFTKCVVNPAAAVFFSGTTQHRDVKQGGVSYEDDYNGNALAVTITPRTIDIRFHRKFSDESVTRILRALLEVPEMNWCRDFTVRYQGRTLF